MMLLQDGQDLGEQQLAGTVMMFLLVALRCDGCLARFLPVSTIKEDKRILKSGFLSLEGVRFG